MQVNRSAIVVAAFVVGGLPSCKHGPQKPNCTPPKGQVWFAVGGSEFAPRSQRIPGTFDWDGGWPCSLDLAIGEQPSLALGANDEAVAAYSGETGVGLHVRQFAAGSWADLDSGPSTLGLAWSSGPVRRPQLLVDLQDRPLVRWGESPDPVYLSRYFEGAWDSFGHAGGSGIVTSWDGAAVVNVVGQPILFYEGPTLPTQILATQYDGTTWLDFPGSGPPQGVSQSASDSFAPSAGTNGSGCLVAAWSVTGLQGGPSGIFVSEYIGGVWNQLVGSGSGGAVSGLDTWARQPEIVCTASGLPVVAWLTADLNSNSITAYVYVARFDGVAWVDLAGSASGLGLTGGPVCEFSIALDRNDNPIVAWRSGCASPLDADQGTNEIYLKQFNGTTWQGIDGSDSGGGVSNSEVGGSSPSVAVSNDMICVAWSEGEPYYAECDPAAVDEPDSYCYPYGTGHPRILIRCANY